MAACAGRRYEPAPIAAGAAASRYEARDLADPGLREFEEAYLGRPVSAWPPSTWDFQALSLAALYFSPVLDAARARIAATQAALVSAGARPNPTLGIAPGIPSPYLLNVELAIPLETAGKRRHRIEAARNLDQAARLDLAASAWAVRRAVRSALLNYLVASQLREALGSEGKIRAEQLAILERVAAAGEIPRSEINLARIELSKTRLAIHMSEAQAAESKAALAAAIGIPAAALPDAQISWPHMDDLPSAATFSPEAIRSDAVVNRLDVRSSLVQYAAAEAGLQLEIAKQYPDVNLGPGYTYEERQSFFTVGFSTVIPLFNRNQGPIAEAEAHRQEAAAAFQEVQARAIEQSDRAFAVYTSALKELAEAGSLMDLLAAQRRATQESVRVGEQDRLSLADVRIQDSVSVRARLDALAHAQAALGDLEDAVQRPLAGDDEFPIGSDSVPLNTLHRE